MGQLETDTEVIAPTCGSKWRRFLEPIGNSPWVRVLRIVTISELGTFNRGTTETRASYWEDTAIGVTEDAWEGYRIPSHLFGSPAKSQGKRARVGSHGKELQCPDSVG